MISHAVKKRKRKKTDDSASSRALGQSTQQSNIHLSLIANPQAWISLSPALTFASLSPPSGALGRLRQMGEVIRILVIGFGDRGCMKGNV